MPAKKPSGAQYRKRKKADADAARKAEAVRGAQPGGAARIGGLDFSDLPSPPLGDPVAAIPWWNDVLLVCADKVLRDTQMPLEQKINWLKDGAAKAGMIRDKAAEQHEIKKILRRAQGQKDAAGLDDVRGQAKPRIPRPPP